MGLVSSSPSCRLLASLSANAALGLTRIAQRRILADILLDFLRTDGDVGHRLTRSGSTPTAFGDWSGPCRAINPDERH